MSGAEGRWAAIRLGAGLGLALWGVEVFGATQSRTTFWLDAPTVSLAGIYVLLLGLAGALGGVGMVARAMAALAALAAAVYCFSESVLSTQTTRIALAVGGGVVWFAFDAWLARRGRSPRARTWLSAAAWMFATTQAALPRRAVLAVLDGRWGDLGGLGLRLVLVAVVGSAALAIVALFVRRPRVGALTGVGTALIAIVTLTDLGPKAAEVARGEGHRDVVLVVLDSLRADAVVADQMPALHAWAATGVQFTDAHSPSVSTRYSLSHMLGLPLAERPALLGRWAPVRDGWADGLPARARRLGLRTHLISDYAANALAHLEIYRWDHVATDPTRALLLPRLPWVIAALFDGGDARLRRLRGSKRPFATGSAVGDLDQRLATTDAPGLFVLHLAVPHAPYNLPPYRSTTLEGPSLAETQAINERLRLGPTRGVVHPTERAQLYRLAVRAADEQVAALRAVLEQRRPGAKAPLVIITADHGESLGARGVVGHGRSLFPDGHHVPLVMVGPGVPSGRSVPTPVSSRALTVSVLHWLGAAPIDGTLQAVLAGAPAKPLVVWHPRGTVVRHDGWALIWTEDERQLGRPNAWAHRQRYQLFEVGTDPERAHDRFPDAPPARERLLDLLETEPTIPEPSRAAARRDRPVPGG